ncbi:exodeoxyribonuclease V subunit gamma [Sesbania bispinosa]|nr:exodeoxyribonuclease V subunit gamma [Sesbania bispinosa]
MPLLDAKRRYRGAEDEDDNTCGIDDWRSEAVVRRNGVTQHDYGRWWCSEDGDDVGTYAGERFGACLPGSAIWV